MSKYLLEKDWQAALNEIFGMITDADRHEDFSSEADRLRYRFQCIYLAGPPPWRNIYDHA